MLDRFIKLFVVALVFIGLDAGRIHGRDQRVVLSEGEVRAKLVERTGVAWRDVVFDPTVGVIRLLARDYPPGIGPEVTLPKEERLDRAVDSGMKFLRKIHDLLGLSGKELLDVRLSEVREKEYKNKYKSRVRKFIVYFHQEVDGIPVWGARIKLSMNRRYEVYRVRSIWYPGLEAPAKPRYTKRGIYEVARKHYRVKILPLQEHIKLYILPNVERLAYQLHLGIPINRCAFFDAMTGELIRERINFYRVNIEGVVSGDIDGLDDSQPGGSDGTQTLPGLRVHIHDDNDFSEDGTPWKGYTNLNGEYSAVGLEVYEIGWPVYDNVDYYVEANLMSDWVEVRHGEQLDIWAEVLEFFDWIGDLVDEMHEGPIIKAYNPDWGDPSDDYVNLNKGETWQADLNFTGNGVMREGLVFIVR
jgi:hypothetical protein